MDIRGQLEYAHNKASTLALVEFIGNDKKKFRTLIEIFLEGEYRLTQRAAWPLSYVAIQHPALIAPYFEQLVKKLQGPKQHPAIARNILRIFQTAEIPETQSGTVIDVCFAFITDPAQPIAIRAFAITVAAGICARYAELKNELIPILRDLQQFPQPPAITVRVKSALKKLKANTP